MALQSIGVQYFGGTFVGNHVHKTLKVTEVITQDVCY